MKSKKKVRKYKRNTKKERKLKKAKKIKKQTKSKKKQKAGAALNTPPPISQENRIQQGPPPINRLSNQDEPESVNHPQFLYLSEDDDESIDLPDALDFMDPTPEVLPPGYTAGQAAEWVEPTDPGNKGISVLMNPAPLTDQQDASFAVADDEQLRADSADTIQSAARSWLNNRMPPEIRRISQLENEPLYIEVSPYEVPEAAYPNLAQQQNDMAIDTLNDPNKSLEELKKDWETKADSWEGVYNDMKDREEKTGWALPSIVTVQNPGEPPYTITGEKATHDTQNYLNDLILRRNLLLNSKNILEGGIIRHDDGTDVSDRWRRAALRAAREYLKENEDLVNIAKEQLKMHEKIRVNFNKNAYINAEEPKIMAKAAYERKKSKLKKTKK